MSAILPSAFLISAMLQLLMAVYAWGRREHTAARPLAVVFFIGFTWAFTYGMDLFSAGLAEKIAWMEVRLSFLRFLSLALLWMVHEHLGLKRLPRRQILMLLILPALGVALAWSSDPLHLFRYDFSLQQAGPLTLLNWKPGPLHWILHFFDISIYAAAFYQLLRSLADSSPLRRRQSLMILAALILPLLSYLSYAFFKISPLSGINLTPILVLVSELLLALSILRYGWLRIGPMARSALVDILPGGLVVLDAHGQLVDLNPYAQEKLGIQLQQAAGRSAHEAFAPLGDEFLKVLETEQGRKEILRFKRLGREEYLEFQVMPLMDNLGAAKGRLAYFTDVTQQKQEELRLMQLTQAVDQSPASVVITDLQGDIIYVNPSFSSLTGYSLAEVIGKNPRLIQSGQTPGSVYDEMWRTIQSGRAWEGELLNRKKNGELYWELEVIAPTRDRDGRIINFIAVKEDITKRKEAEQALQEANRQLADNLEKIRRLQSVLSEQAIRDPLTNLHNRRYLEEVIEREFQRAVRQKRPLSVVMIDMDHFKNVNDVYGHAAGDACLVLLAGLLERNIRKSDIACRYGGEEFLLLLLDTDLEKAEQHAERIRKLYEEMEIVFEGRQLHATISLGVASHPQHGAAHAEVIKKADRALYESKNAGRNRVTTWSEKAGPINPVEQP